MFARRCEVALRVSKPAPLTLALIVICVVCYIPDLLGLRFFGMQLGDWMAVGPDSFSRPWEFVTAIFAHGSIEHLAMNMISLFWLGTMIEDIQGKVKFAIIFFASGIFGNVLFALIANGYAVGASGSIFGLLGAGAYLLYQMRDNPAARGMFQGMIAMLALNIFNSFLPGIALEAHLGGLVAGVACEAAIVAIDRKKLPR